VQLGLENKKKTTWAAGLVILALVAVGYEFIPFLTESSTPSSSAQAATPSTPRPAAHSTNTNQKKTGKKARSENLDPTLRLDRLAASENTQYEGNGRNIFVALAEPVVIPHPAGTGTTDQPGGNPTYVAPPPPPAPPIPLKFYGFASRAGEPKKIFLKLNEDVFVAGEGEIVDRRYKVLHISNASVQIQDVVNSGAPQSIPLTPE
jgi:hypothetical protein